MAGGWVGNLWAGGPSQCAVFVSADGAEWGRIDDPAFADGITALAVSRDSTLIALGCSIGDVQPILVSLNGRDWDRIYSDPFGPGCRLGAQAVTAGGPGFVAVGGVGIGQTEEFDAMCVWGIRGRHRLGAAPEPR